MADAHDFERPAGERYLFPHVEPSTTPDGGPEAVGAIRHNIRYLHRHLLGERLVDNDRELEATYQLFRRIWGKGHQRIQDEHRGDKLISQCQGEMLDSARTTQSAPGRPSDVSDVRLRLLVRLTHPDTTRALPWIAAIF